MKKNIKFIFIVIGIFVIHGCATSGISPSRTPAQASTSSENDTTSEVPVTPVDFKTKDVILKDLTFYKTPEDLHNTFNDAIKGAKKSIIMEMFHLTDPETEADLKALPQYVQVTLILDHGMASSGPAKNIADEFEVAPYKSHFTIVRSSPKFAITHSKAMVVDNELQSAKAYVSSINLTQAADKTRDYGIATQDKSIITDLLKVFAADVKNAAKSTEITPSFTDNNLIFAPVPESAKGKLLGLIEKTYKESPHQKFIYSTVENLSDPDINAEFVKAAAAGVVVKIIVPMCDENPNKSFNYKPLTGMAGVQGRMMPTEGRPETPYMHGKMIVTSEGTAYIGSENFTINSLMKSRETGIIFNNEAVAAQLIDTFNVDWDRASSPALCNSNDSPSANPRPKRPRKTTSN